MLSPLTDPYLYYTSTSTPKTFDVLAHTSNVASNANVSFTFNGKTNSAVLQSCTGLRLYVAPAQQQAVHKCDN